MKRACFLLVLSLFYCKKEGPLSMEPSASEPDPHAAVSEVVLTDGGAVLRVRVPANHHAYLDKGPAGAFIPIAPDWEGLVKAGRIQKAPNLSRSPAGTLDRDSGAMVLRGTGEFEYKGSLQDLAGETIQVRTQVCDDIKGICYRPKTETVTIQKL
jgi:hypothetical protein